MVEEDTSLVLLRIRKMWQNIGQQNLVRSSSYFKVSSLVKNETYLSKFKQNTTILNSIISF